MTTKEKILTFLENNKGIYYSGEQLARKLKISRTSIWKAINSLRKDGYQIDAITNKGYCLSVGNDIISLQGIQKYLLPICSNLQFEIHKKVSSTNTIARQMALEGAKEGYVIIANGQDNGKGRLGRNFFSPEQTGIYMSIILRPQDPKLASTFTTIAAVAACEAIESNSNKQAKIKWVNDIFIDGKKVSGILTEAVYSLENGLLEYAILGIGLNVYPPQEGFPIELQDIAGSVFNQVHNDAKNRLIASFLNQFMQYYQTNDNYLDKYRNRSFIIGKKITIQKNNSTQLATALKINDNCHLVVKYPDGKIETLKAGEISIKL